MGGKTAKRNEDRANARARLRAEREQADRKARVRRRFGIGAVVGALVAAGVAVAIATAGGGSASGPLTIPANATGKNGTVIVYGSASAKHTLDVYEDFRCPYCDELEKTDGTVIKQLADDGTYKIQYHMGTFLDGNLGGSGSMQALAAAGAALNESPQMFKAFHDALYANQPDEHDDAFAGKDHLLELAEKVPGLSTAAFVTAVKDGTYSAWAHKVSDAFNSSGVSGTPTVKLDGRSITVLDSAGSPISPDQYTALIKAAAK